MVYTIFSSVKCDGGEKVAKRTLDVVVRIQVRAWLFFLPPALCIPAPVLKGERPVAAGCHFWGGGMARKVYLMYLMYLFPRVRGEKKRGKIDIEEAKTHTYTYTPTLSPACHRPGPCLHPLSPRTPEG